jgi:hypothetical protein
MTNWSLLASRSSSFLDTYGDANDFWQLTPSSLPELYVDVLVFILGRAYNVVYLLSGLPSIIHTSSWK